MGASAGTGERVRIGDLDVDVSAGVVRRQGQRLPLSPRTFDLLVVLARRAPATVRRHELLEAVWPEEIVTDQTLSHRVMVLRKALGDHAESPCYVSGERGWGYRMIAPVERLGPDPSPSSPRPRAPLRAATLAVVSVALLLSLLQGHDGAPRKPPTVAVPPLHQRVTPPGLEQYGQDLALALRARLLRQTGIRVVEWRSSSPSRLWVEGEVAGDSDRLHLSLRLVDGQKANPVWEREFEGSYYELRAREEQVLRDLDAAVQAQLPSEFRVVARPPVSPRVERFCLRGEIYWLSWSEEGLRNALQSWLQAATLAPEHAPAVAGLSLTEAVQGLLGYRNPIDAAREARERARRALALDPSLPAAHLAAGLVQLLYDGDIEGAERSLSRAAALGPHELPVALGEALVLQARGRFQESLRRLQRDWDDNLESAGARLLMGHNLAALGRWEQAELAYEKATRLRWPPASAYRGLAECGTLLDRKDLALRALRQEAVLRGSVALPNTLDRAWAHLCAAGALTPRETVRACLLAGECGAARRALERGLIARMPFSVFVRADPGYRRHDCPLVPA